jgi:hypothetical protein
MPDINDFEREMQFMAMERLLRQHAEFRQRHPQQQGGGGAFAAWEQMERNLWDLMGEDDIPVFPPRAPTPGQERFGGLPPYHQEYRPPTPPRSQAGSFY